MGRNLHSLRLRSRRLPSRRPRCSRRRIGAAAAAVALFAVPTSSIGPAAAALRGPTHAAPRARARALDVSWIASVVISGNPRIIAGATTGTLGQGSVLYRARFIPGGPRQTAFYFQLKLYYDRGLVRAVANGVGTDEADGREVFTGSVKIAGGTGPFRRARGSGTISGEATAFNDQTHLRLTHQRITGTITY